MGIGVPGEGGVGAHSFATLELWQEQEVALIQWMEEWEFVQAMAHRLSHRSAIQMSVHVRNTT